MKQITIEEIKAEHSKVARMIADFEAQSASQIIIIGARTIQLKAGEFYCGTILTDGRPDYDLIGLPGEIAAISWNEAIQQQADDKLLPNRRELNLARANAAEHFKCEAYWSCEPYASASDYAWCQYFSDGSQSYGVKDIELRVRFVRRLEIL